MEQWYVLYTEPDTEYQVANTLDQYQILTYLPEFKSSNQDRGELLFPCYLFARFDFSGIRSFPTQSIPGLRQVMGFGGQPTPLPDEIVALIQNKLAEMEAAGSWQGASSLQGEPPPIVDRRFKDILAIFTSPTRSARRVQALLNTLGYARQVQLKAKDLTGEIPFVKRPRRTRGKGRPIIRSKPSPG